MLKLRLQKRTFKNHNGIIGNIKDEIGTRESLRVKYWYIWFVLLATHHPWSPKMSREIRFDKKLFRRKHVADLQGS